MSTTKCKACGADVKATMRFCAACGTQVEHEPAIEEATAVAPEAEKKAYFHIKKIIRFAIIGGAALLAIIVAVTLLTPAKYDHVKGTIRLDQDGDSICVIANGEISAEIDGRLVSSARNIDGTVAAALVANDDKGYDDNPNNHSLYLITDKPQLISDEASSYCLSASGKAVAYVKAYYSYAGTAELWHYSGGVNTKLTSAFNLDCRYAISPDGKTVAYIDDDGGRQTGYIWDGQTTELGRDIQPLAVSNGAKYIYFIRNDAFFVQRGSNSDSRERLCDSSELTEIYANRDLSQIVYDTGARTFVYTKGGGRQSLARGFRNWILPNGTASQMQRSKNVVVSIYGMSGFADTFYRNADNSIVHVNRKYETNNVARNASAQLANDGKTLIFLRNRGIYKVDGTNAKAEATEIVSEAYTVTSFVATYDGKAVFFTNDMDELYYQKGKGRPTTVSDYVSLDGRGINYGLYKGKTLYYVCDEELYASSGGKGSVIRGVGGRVQSASSGLYGVTVTSLEDGDSVFYYSSDGKTFKSTR